jgi:hypothetical protein
VVNRILERIAMLRDRIQLDSLDIVGRFLNINGEHLREEMEIMKETNRILLHEEHQDDRCDQQQL